MKKQIRENISYCFSYITIVLICICCNFIDTQLVAFLIDDSEPAIPLKDIYVFVLNFIIIIYPFFCKILFITLWLFCLMVFPQCYLTKFFNYVSKNNIRKIIFLLISVIIDLLCIYTVNFFEYPYIGNFSLTNLDITLIFVYIILLASISINLLLLYFIWFIIDITKNIKNKE